MSEPLIVDSFAGGGGASTGIEMALGRSPDYAINHSAAALAMHEANHPDTIHLDSNIWDVQPGDVAQGRPVGLLWASPDCKHFSKAKGGAPKDRNIRDLAWIVVKWAEHVKPDVILMENVEEFQTWGPVGEDGQPIKEFEGQTFELWIKRLRKAGYKVQFRELRCCDYGSPTIRKRFFMIARRDARSIVWPKPTHGDPNSEAVKSGKLKPWRTAAECIDWTIPCPSIFDTSAEIMEKHGLRAVRPLADNTLARVARGMKRYVLDAADPFTVQLTGGDATAPSVSRFNGGATGQDMRLPIATVTANSWIKKPGGAAPLGIISPVLTYAQHGGRSRSVEDPHHTITASKKDQNALIAATMVHVGNGERAGQSPRSYELCKPLGTVVAGGVKHYPVTAFLAQHNKAKNGHNPGRPINAPISNITVSGSHQMLVCPLIARHFGASVGHSLADPLGTVTAGGGGKSGLVAPWMAKYYGTGDGARSDDPMHTITVKDRMGHVQAELSAPPFSPGHEARARQVAEFLRAHGAWEGGEFVTVAIRGAEFVVVDIGMRMLAPRELFNAQGFPADYVIEGVWRKEVEDWVFHPFTKNQQVSCCGNSGPPDMAAALAA